ncbi:hypothetical protein [Streptomyces bobili]|uniref:hypothetical protein n=1 Tax=Streptomyces bobili TaxID=67280 RepID=UPI00379C493F
MERHAFTTVDRGRYGSKFWCGSLPTPGPVRLDASTPRRLDAAFPVTGYRSTLTVHEVPRERETSRVEWSGVFIPAGRR